MTWPSADVSTTNIDAGTDSPASARADIKDLADKFNQIRNHLSTFGQTLVTYTTAALARAGLGSTTVGDALFIAASASAARSTLVVASTGELQAQTYTAFTTGGTSTAFTLTPSPVISSYVAGQRFRVKFNAANTTTTPTLNINALGVKNLKVYDSTGAKQNPAVGAFAANMLTDVEYDGTDMVVLDPLPASMPASSPVRQTVLGGPVNATTGVADFLPATSGTLSITSTGVSSTVPFVVTAANGFSSLGAVDRIGISTANLTWSSLTAANTNYLYVDVDAAGALTTGKTTVAPTYPQGGARSITSNQAQFNVGEMSMTVGNGAAAVQTWRVFVGQVVCDGSGVTSSISYAYRGEFESAETALALSGAGPTVLTANHNIGVQPRDLRSVLRCKTTDLGYAVDEEVPLAHVGRSGASASGPTIQQYAGKLTIKSLSTNTGSEIPGLRDVSTGTFGTLTEGNWRMVHRASRGW